MPAVFGALTDDIRNAPPCQAKQTENEDFFTLALRTERSNPATRSSGLLRRYRSSQ